MKGFLFLLCLNFAMSADVLSRTGQIKFDVDDDLSSEMTLNAVGLGVGIVPAANLHIAGNAVVTGNLLIGKTTGKSSLDISGTISFGHETVSAPSTLSRQSVVFADSSSDNLILTLPYSGNVTGRIIKVKKVSIDNYVAVVPESPDSFNEYIYAPSTGNDTLPYAEFLSASNTWHLMSNSNVNERWEPLATSNLALWLDASDTTTITSSSDNVSQWDDKSGNDYHVTQSTANKHPKTNTRTINGLNVLDFNGTSERLSSAQDIFVSDQNYTKIVVYLTDDLGVLNNLVTIGSSAFYQELNMWHNGNQFSSSSYPGASVPMVAIGRYDSGVQSDIFINGTNVGTSMAHGAWANDGNHLLIASHGGGSYLDGVIAEMIVLDYAASTELREKIEGYLAWKWGLRSDLPLAHPYKNTPPTK